MEVKEESERCRRSRRRSFSPEEEKRRREVELTLEKSKILFGTTLHPKNFNNKITVSQISLHFSPKIQKIESANNRGQEDEYNNREAEKQRTSRNNGHPETTDIQDFVSLIDTIQGFSR